MPFYRSINRGPVHERRLDLNFFDFRGSPGLAILTLVMVLMWPPLGLAMLFLYAGVRTSSGLYYFVYEKGSRGWFLFWSLVFFPVALILLILNGCALVHEELCVIIEETNDPDV